MPRFHVVRVYQAIGVYGGNLFAFAVADADAANRVVSDGYGERLQAQARADHMNRFAERFEQTQRSR